MTGKVSADILKDASASAVIVGHSERRRHHGETDVVVASKAGSAWRSGLLAIVCIGASESQRSDGATLSSLAEQRAGGLPERPAGSELAIAYEPPGPSAPAGSPAPRRSWRLSHTCERA